MTDNFNTRSPILSTDTQMCEGNYIETHGRHNGPIREVLVEESKWHKYTFNYCYNAIEEDTNRGFTVTIKE